MGVRQATALVRAYAATSGAVALRRGLPVYVGLLAVAALLFGGNGLEATTVVAAAETSSWTRGLLGAGWLVLTAPTLEALWRTPASFWLRSLPVARAGHIAVLLAMSALAEAPWVALWGAGGGVAAGALALVAALAGHAVVLARPAGPAGWGMLAIAAAGWLWAPRWGLALGTCPIVLVAFHAAWVAAPARPGARPRAWIGGPGALALTLALLAGLVRGHAPALLRGALLAALATAAAWLAALHNAADAATRLYYACGFLAPALVIAGSAASGPALALEQRAAWLLRTSGATARTRLAAATLAVAVPGAALGLLAAGALALLWRTDATVTSQLFVALALAGAGLAGLAGLAARYAATLGARGPGRLVALLLVAIVAAEVVLAQFGGAAPALWIAATITIWLIGHVRSTGRGRVAAGDTGGVGMLEITGVRKRLGGRWVLDGVDLRCGAGELALVLGENGAGKSTLLRIAAGIVEPEAGAVTVAGAPLLGGGVAARRALGYAPDTADAFPELSVREVVSLVAALKRSSAPPEALRERLGLAQVWHQRMRTLSFGQVKRSYLLAAWIGPPALLVLDEPSNGLDPDGARTLAELLRERADAGGASLVATNDAAFAALLPGARHRLRAGRLVTDG